MRFPHTTNHKWQVDVSSNIFITNHKWQVVMVLIWITISINFILTHNNLPPMIYYENVMDMVFL